MKKSILFLISVVLLASCTKEFVENTVADTGRNETSLTVLGAMHFDVDTKTVYETNDDGNIVSSFIVGETDGDEIGLYDVKGSKVYKNKKFKATTTTMKGDKEWAVFTGSEDVTDLVDVDDDVYSYYPYRSGELEVIGGTKAAEWDGYRGMVIATEQKMKSGTRENPSFEHVGSYFPLVGKPTKVTGDDDHKVIELSFSNPFALAKLGIKNGTSFNDLVITGFDWSIPDTPMTGSFSVDLKNPNAVPVAGETTYDKVSVIFTNEPTVAIDETAYGIAIVAPCKQDKIALTVHTNKGDFVREAFTPSTIVSFVYSDIYRYSVTIKDEHLKLTGDWQKVSAQTELTTGKYVLVYPQGTDYKVFSFEKTMTNAQDAFALLTEKHSFEEVLPMRTELFQTLINGNYQTVTSPVENAELLDIPEDVASVVAMDATTEDGEYGRGSVVLKSTSVKNLNVTKAYIELGNDGAATITAQVDAVDVKDILANLRDHEISVTFGNVLSFAGSKVGVSNATMASALGVFDKLCVVAKGVIQQQGFGTLMDIDHNTRVLDVFAQYYDNVAPMSYAYNADVAFGWIKPVGFYAANDGFSAHIPMPSSIWFDRLDASLTPGENSKAAFVAYWKQFDVDYPSYAQFLGKTSLFGRIAEMLLAGGDISDDLFNEVAGINWSAIGRAYDRYVESLNGDPLEKVYLYKYIGE